MDLLKWNAARLKKNPSTPGTQAPDHMPAHGAIRRAPVRTIATMMWDNGPRQVFGQVVEMHPKSATIKTETTIPAGTRLNMTLAVVGHGQQARFEVEGIVREQTTFEGRRAYLVDFLASSPAAQSVLGELYHEATRSAL